MFWDVSFPQACRERMDKGLSSDSHTLQNQKVSEASKSGRGTIMIPKSCLGS